MMTHIEQASRRHFPMVLADNVVGKRVDMPTYFEVEDALEPTVFPENSQTARWFNMPTERRDARKQQLFELQRQTHQDAVVFYDGDKAIGWSAGRMTGATDFLMDVTGVHPEYQGRGIYSTFLRRYLPYLRDIAYERVISYHSPTNRAVLIAKLKAGSPTFTHCSHRHTFRMTGSRSVDGSQRG